MSASDTVEEAEDLVAGYRPPAEAFDELLDSSGKVRPQWERVMRGLQDIGVDELGFRDELLNRLINENGITYNVYQAKDSGVRPWKMDLLPTLIEYADWQRIEKGLCQRVRLLNAVLKDVYGEAELVRNADIPMDLVMPNPAFLRPCHQVEPAGGLHIHMYAADLARSPDGQWWVLSDRVEAPSGIGYALENRFLISQVLPEIFRNSGAMRLQPFFDEMRASFERLVQRKTENPRIVLLSPGPANESFFEHSFLARNLGYPLVEGSDLTVREKGVFLKTVSGMRRVDVIIRRIDSEFCDPLELRDDSLLGIPGLVHCVRSGCVVIANSLGSGFVQTPALSAFLPGLCKQLLGEELHMPSVATWWCGQEKEKQYVLDHLQELVLKPVFRKRFGESVFGQDLSRESLDNLRRQILASPGDWCAQEQVARATTPVFQKGRLSSRHFLLRVFLVAGREEGTYSMMPGGLTRITPDLTSYSVSVQQGGHSQDTWMLSEDQIPTPDIPLPNTGPVTIQRQTALLPSRAADNLYWLGRYIDRVEHQLRVVRSLASKLREDSLVLDSHDLVPYLDFLLPREALGRLVPVDADGPLFAEFKEPLVYTRLEEELACQIWDENRPGNLVSALDDVARTASTVKERLSVDMWHAVNELIQQREKPARAFQARKEVNEFVLNSMLLAIGAVIGGISENMTRSNDWLFLEIGRRVERGIFVADLLLHVLGKAVPAERGRLNDLLIVMDSSYTYRGRYLTNLRIEPVADLILMDESNPRSLLFQLQLLNDALAQLPGCNRTEPFSKVEKLGLRAFSRLRLADLDQLLAPNAEGVRVELHSTLESLMEDLKLLSTLLAQRYFAHGRSGILSEDLHRDPLRD